MSDGTNSRTSKITVIQAVYGAVQGVREVTRRVQELVDEGKTEFRADNETLVPPPDKDPAKTDKHFAMNYTVGSSNYTFACEEGQMVTLRTSETPRGEFQVVAAAYQPVVKVIAVVPETCENYCTFGGFQNGDGQEEGASRGPVDRHPRSGPQPRPSVL